MRTPCRCGDPTSIGTPRVNLVNTHKLVEDPTTKCGIAKPKICKPVLDEQIIDLQTWSSLPIAPHLTIRGTSAGGGAKTYPKDFMGLTHLPTSGWFQGSMQT